MTFAYFKSVITLRNLKRRYRVNSIKKLTRQTFGAYILRHEYWDEVANALRMGRALQSIDGVEWRIVA